MRHQGIWRILAFGRHILGTNVGRLDYELCRRIVGVRFVTNLLQRYSTTEKNIARMLERRSHLGDGSTNAYAKRVANGIDMEIGRRPILRLSLWNTGVRNLCHGLEHVVVLEPFVRDASRATE